MPPILSRVVLSHSILFRGLYRFLALYNDMEYHVEPRLIMSSSTRDGDFMQQLALRSRTSMGTGSMSPEAMEWEILPEDIIICKDPYGRDWQLGTGGFGSVRISSSPSTLRIELSHLHVDCSLHTFGEPAWPAEHCG